MHWLISFRSLWRTLFRSSRLERDLDAEMQQYVALLTARHVERGLAPADARRAALVECEGVEQTKEKVRDARIGAGIGSFVNDVRLAFRGMRRNPGFAATAILTLALGIGATVSIFSIVRAVLLRPLPYRDAEQLVVVSNEKDGEVMELSPGRFLDVRKRAPGLSGVAGFSVIVVNLVGSGNPERLLAATVSTDFFDVVGVQPLLGRTFEVGREEQRVAVLSYGLWTSRFGGDPSIVGRDIMLDSGNHTVVGVMPREFTWMPDSAKPELWIPAPLREVPAVRLKVERLTERRDFFYFLAIARMKPGLTVREVNTGLAALARALAREHPDTDRNHGLRATATGEMIAGSARTPLLLLLGAVGLVLVVACANVANLLLGRTLARRGEIAIRLALGAGRGRLARQFLAEGLVLCGTAAMLGVVVAHFTMASLVAVSPADIARLSETRVDGAVLGFAALLLVGTAVVLGLAPLIDARRVAGTLHEASRRVSARRMGARNFMLVGEVAVAVMLVIGAGLLVRSFVALQRVNTGIARPGQLLTFDLPIGADRASTPKRQAPFYQEVLDRVRVLPRVRAAGAALALPMSGQDFQTSIYFEGRPAPPAGQADHAGFSSITPGYFGAVGARLLAGRDITVADGADAPRVVVVNETFARRFWGRESPIGRRLSLTRGANAKMMIVVGVVQDVRHLGPAEPPRAEFFMPVAQEPFPAMTFVVRTDGDPLRLVASVRAAVTAIDPAQPIANVRTFEDYVQGSVARSRFLASLLTGFGGLALLLAAIGVYGVMSWSVVERRQEIGVRLAVGAAPRSVATMILRQGGLQLLVGLLAGATGAAALSRALSGVLFGVRPDDPVTYAATLALLTLVGLAALWLPAYRASRVDPVSVLRE